MADKTHGLTILMPNLPGDLVDEDGRVSDYDGIVYRADEVNALLDRKDEEIVQMHRALERLGMNVPEEEQRRQCNELGRNVPEEERSRFYDRLCLQGKVVN